MAGTRNRLLTYSCVALSMCCVVLNVLWARNALIPSSFPIETDTRMPKTRPLDPAQINVHADYPLDSRVCSEDALRVPMHPALLSFLDLTRYNLETEESNLTFSKANLHDYGYNPQKLVQLQACLYYTLHQWREFAATHGMTNWVGQGGTVMGAMCHGGMNPWEDDIDVVLAECTKLDALWEKGKDVAQVFPDIRKQEYYWESSDQVFEGRLVATNLIVLKEVKGSHWYKVKTVTQCQSGLKPSAVEISGINIECIRPTRSDGKVEALDASGWQVYAFKNGLDDVMFGPTKIQLMPLDILNNYIVARYDKRDPCSFPFSNGQGESTPKIPNDESLTGNYKYVPTIREYTMDYTMKKWYTSKAQRDKWRLQAGSNRQNELTREVPNLDQVEIVNTISDGCNISNGTLKIVGFNAERGTHWSKFAKLIDSEQADVIILNEMDIGMARSGNVHTTRRLAYALKMNYAFAVEFIELTRGTEKEQEATTGKRDALGLHGNAILTKCRIGSDAIVVRDPLSPAYFSKRSTSVNANGYEIRLGGRMGMFARIHHEESHYVIGSAHTLSESNSNQASLEEYFNQRGKSTLGIVVQGDISPTFCKWAGLQYADNPKHFTWPASCVPKLKLGTIRGDYICTNMQAIEEDRVIAPCYQQEDGRNMTLSDHSIVSVMLQAN